MFNFPVLKWNTIIIDRESPLRKVVHSLYGLTYTAKYHIDSFHYVYFRT